MISNDEGATTSEDDYNELSFGSTSQWSSIYSNDQLNTSNDMSYESNSSNDNDTRSHSRVNEDNSSSSVHNNISDDSSEKIPRTGHKKAR